MFVCRFMCVCVACLLVCLLVGLFACLRVCVRAGVAWFGLGWVALLLFVWMFVCLCVWL